MTKELPETLQHTLNAVRTKIPRLLTRPKKGVALPVDCVAFSYAYRVIDDKNRIRAYYHAICSHPNRGVQFGCLLTSTAPDGRETRVRGSNCSFQVKNHKKGAAALRTRIEKREEETNPPF